MIDLDLFAPDRDPEPTPFTVEVVSCAGWERRPVLYPAPLLELPPLAPPRRLWAHLFRLRCVALYHSSGIEPACVHSTCCLLLASGIECRGCLFELLSLFNNVDWFQKLYFGDDRECVKAILNPNAFQSPGAN